MASLVGEPCVGGKCGDMFVDLLNQYPNVILNLVGHTHYNKIVPRPDDTRGVENGYWEIQTCSTSYWPQQARILEFVVYDSGIAEIWSTMLDHYPLSTSGDTNTLTQLGRRLALTDPQIPIYPESDPPAPWGNGLASDRNRVMRVRIPVDILNEIRDQNPSSLITSRDVFPGGQILQSQ